MKTKIALITLVILFITLLSCGKGGESLSNIPGGDTTTSGHNASKKINATIDDFIRIALTGTRVDFPKGVFKGEPIVAITDSTAESYFNTDRLPKGSKYVLCGIGFNTPSDEVYYKNLTCTIPLNLPDTKTEPNPIVKAGDLLKVYRYDLINNVWVEYSATTATVLADAKSASIVFPFSGQDGANSYFACFNLFATANKIHTLTDIVASSATAKVKDVITLSTIADDPERDSLVFVWSISTNPENQGALNTEIRTTNTDGTVKSQIGFAALKAGDYIVTITVSDPKGLSVSKTISLTITS